jgi:hypothetical protein
MNPLYFYSFVFIHFPSYLSYFTYLMIFFSSPIGLSTSTY